MAFKSVEQFNGDRYRGLFRLVNDGDSADVIFLYTAIKDMLVAQAHYIKSADYSGYVHCVGQGCPACSKGIRVQTKLFIPVYNIDKEEIEFWDRNMKFEPQMEKDVFSRFANPSEYVFRITRHGIPNDINTKYTIEPIGRNTFIPYSAILAKLNTKMPDAYEAIIREVSASELATMLQNSGNDSASNMPEYTPIPRAGYQANMPETFVDASEAVASAEETVTVNFTPSAVEDIPAPSDDFTNDDSESGATGSDNIDTSLPTPEF